MEASKTRETARLRVVPSAREGNATLCLTRKIGGCVVLRFLDGEYLVLRVIRDPVSKKEGCTLHWPTDSKRNYQHCVQINQIGFSLIFDSKTCVDILMGKGRDRNQTKLWLSLPHIILADRWEILVKKSPEIAIKIRDELPDLRLTI